MTVPPGGGGESSSLEGRWTWGGGGGIGGFYQLLAHYSMEGEECSQHLEIFLRTR